MNEFVGTLGYIALIHCIAQLGYVSVTPSAMSCGKYYASFPSTVDRTGWVRILTFACL